MSHVFKRQRVALWAAFLAVMIQSNLAIGQDWIYTIVDGDNLWNLSEKHLDRVTRFSQLQKINAIKNPYRMRPGTKLRVPLKWIRSNPVPAKILELQGNVEIIRSSGTVEQLTTSGPLIRLGDQLRTGPNSTVAIEFADKTLLTLHSDSLARFDHLSAHGVTGMVDSRLNLKKGRMDTRVTPAVGPGSRFEIHTPSAISAVRGTEYRASVSEDEQSSNIEVLKGKVLVKGASKSTLVNAGFGTQVASGKPPIAPRELLAPPILKSIPSPIESLNWPLAWDPLEGAEQYRLEVAIDDQFNTLEGQQLTGHARAALPDLPDGAYFVRVRGVTALGLEGKNRVDRIVLDVHPQPPVPLLPNEARVFRGKAPELKWTASSEAAKYRLELSSDPTFRTPLTVEDGLNNNHFDTAGFADPGQYYWRLTSIAEDGEYGPVGDIRSYQIKPIPEKVTPNMESEGDDQLVASWRAGGAGQTYQVQLANDDAFTDLAFDQNITEPKFAFKPMSGQVRYLRVRSIESDGYQGPWGATQRVDPTPGDSAWIVPILGIIGILIL